MPRSLTAKKKYIESLFGRESQHGVPSAEYCTSTVLTGLGTTVGVL